MALNISAVIPHYNQQYCLAKCISSLLEQDVNFNKILIIDDGSNNIKSLKFLSSYNQLYFVKNKVNMGRGFCRNLAINEITEPFIFFLDASNIVKKEYVKTALSHFINDKVAAVSGLIQNNSINDSFASKWRGRHLFKENHKFETQVHDAKSLTTYGTILRRSAVLHVGNFNSALTHSEDKDLGKRLLNAGYKIIGDPNLIVYSIKKDSVLSVLERYWRWYGEEDESMSFYDYLIAIKASIRPMIQQDIMAYDLKSALISFLCPHYGYCRYLFRKFTGKIQKHS
ncbi:glycosyltransferase [Opitutales bacterium]|nr:glycosyltransferase [Opitutales bacterium]